MLAGYGMSKDNRQKTCAVLNDLWDDGHKALRVFCGLIPPHRQRGYLQPVMKGGKLRYHPFVPLALALFGGEVLDPAFDIIHVVDANLREVKWPL